MYTQLIPWTQLNHSQLSLCNNSEELLKFIRELTRSIISPQHMGRFCDWNDFSAAAQNKRKVC